mmetsp:Transcript_16031/g.22835  ORF Transcript_16031/g.22835 Transcript_16031/m.22835 type:complete len:970 (+) Transcript_16031:277-3186(+)|eukprot:CAMPEP_0184863200 /NCGR_PEP_ID=MMETSP0580-20130426/9776_1 /TAXON_ID=1118495 /ORGANISM="Dactyliosolen fragilissimus" /LENGTH=969 /DNA_ID=CAMNT_0027361391 /DNA_START=171 /DNA_END=3080 /DNA_ORIENTATION=+
MSSSNPGSVHQRLQSSPYSAAQANHFGFNNAYHKYNQQLEQYSSKRSHYPLQDKRTHLSPRSTWEKDMEKTQCTSDQRNVKRTNHKLMHDTSSKEEMPKRILFLSPSTEQQHDSKIKSIASKNKGKRKLQNESTSLKYDNSPAFKDEFHRSQSLTSRDSRYFYDKESRTSFDESSTQYSHHTKRENTSLEFYPSCSGTQIFDSESQQDSVTPSKGNRYPSYSRNGNLAQSTRHHILDMQSSSQFYKKSRAGQVIEGDDMKSRNEYNRSGTSRLHYRVEPPRTSPLFGERYMYNQGEISDHKQIALSDLTNKSERAYLNKSISKKNGANDINNAKVERNDEAKSVLGYDYKNSDYVPESKNGDHHSLNLIPSNSSMHSYCTPIVTGNERRRMGPSSTESFQLNTGSSHSYQKSSSKSSVYDNQMDSNLEHYHKLYPSMTQTNTGSLSPTPYDSSPTQTKSTNSMSFAYTTPIPSETGQASKPFQQQNRDLSKINAGLPYFKTSFHSNENKENSMNRYNNHTQAASARHQPYHPANAIGYYSPYNLNHRGFPSNYGYVPRRDNMNTYSHNFHHHIMPGNYTANVKSTSGTSRPARRKKMYSDFVGVTYNKTHAKFQACITHYRKQHYLGRYKLAVDAARAYDESAKLLKGNGWKINFQTKEDYERAKCKEIEENNRKRTDAGLPPASAASLGMITPTISVPQSVQETVAAAESVDSLNHAKTKLFQDGDECKSKADVESCSTGSKLSEKTANENPKNHGKCDERLDNTEIASKFTSLDDSVSKDELASISCAKESNAKSIKGSSLLVTPSPLPQCQLMNTSLKLLPQLSLLNEVKNKVPVLSPLKSPTLPMKSGEETLTNDAKSLDFESLRTCEEKCNRKTNSYHIERPKTMNKNSIFTNETEQEEDFKSLGNNDISVSPVKCKVEKQIDQSHHGENEEINSNLHREKSATTQNGAMTAASVLINLNSPQI